MPRRRHAVGFAIASVLVAAIAALAVSAMAHPDEPAAALHAPAVAAAFPFESYGPGETARLRVSGAAPGAASLRVVFAGRERTPVASLRLPSLRTGERVRIRIGDWPSGLYAARLKTRRGATETPFVVRPRKLGENRVGVVLPDRAWQSSTDLELLQWLEDTGRAVDVLAQEDLDEATAAQLVAAYELLVFPGRHGVRDRSRRRRRERLPQPGWESVVRLGAQGHLPHRRHRRGRVMVSGSVRSPAVRRQLTRLWNPARPNDRDAQRPPESDRRPGSGQSATRRPPRARKLAAAVPGPAPREQFERAEASAC